MKKNDDFIKVRSFLFANVENLLEHMSQQRHMSQVSSDGLFGGESDSMNISWDLEYVPQSKMEVLVKEKESLGLYVSGNPLDEYKDLLTYVQDTVYRDDIILILINKVKKIFTKKGDMMFALLVSTPFGDYEAIIFPKKAMELSPMLAEREIFWVVGKIEEGQKSSTSKVNEEGESVEYEQKPKILIDSMIPLEGDLVELLTKDTTNGRKKQKNELSEHSQKRIQELNIQEFLASYPTQEDDSSDDDTENIQSINEEIEKSQAEPTVLKIYQKYPMEKVKKIKSRLRKAPEEGLSEVIIEVQVAPNEFKKAKGKFWIDMQLIEQLGLDV